MATDTECSGLTDTQLRWAIEQAMRAPSVENTQPWRFGWDREAITLRADLQRGLAVSDPMGRELVISCGAALRTLRLALRQIGRTPDVTLCPDHAEPRLLARIKVADGPPPTDEERKLFTAVARRHTRRGDFADLQIRPDLAVRLQEAAWNDGAQLIFVHDPGPRRRVLDLAREAERIRSEDPEVRAETEAWTPAPGTARRDGVPARAYSSAPSDRREELAPRGFDLDRDQGSAPDGPQPPGGVAALVTEADGVRDWIRGGEALQAVLLTAALDWSFAVLHSGVTEIEGLRAELRRELRTAGYPQLLLRFGYAGNAPITPRRPVAEVVDLAGGPDGT